MRRSTRIASTAITQVPASPSAKSTTSTTSTRQKSMAMSTPKSTTVKSTISKGTTSKVTPKTSTTVAAAASKVTKEETPIKSFASASAFETYVSSSSTSPTGIWVKLSKKSNPVQTMTYDQALDVALCHGWIDGQRKSYDEHSFIQRFTPRRKNSLWSKRNVDKVASLIEQGRMASGGLKEVELAKGDGRWEKAYGGSAAMEVPPDLDEALGITLRKRFDALTRQDRYSMLYKVQTALKDDVRRNRIDAVVKQVKDM